MLHLRAFTPAEKTDEVLRILESERGVAHIGLLRGAGIAPRGDVVEADVAREAVDDLVERLCGLGLDHDGAVTLAELDTALSDAADRAEEVAPGDAADAVVWQELVNRTGEESRLNLTFLAFLTIACLLAAVGVVTDSSVTVVGAMVVGPEFGPLAAIAVGVVLRRRDLVSRAGLALAVGFPLAMLVTAGLTMLGEATGLFNRDVVSGSHEVDFIYQVGPYSLIVAMLAGAAGMLSMTSAKSAALVGVFISVTTVPAARYAVIAAVLGDWDRSLESTRQLAVNLVGIVLAAIAVLFFRRRRQRAGAVERPLPRG